MVDIQPRRLSLEDGALMISWSDGRTDRLPLQELRDACPCASCRAQAGQADAAPDQSVLPIIDLNAAQPLRLERIEPVGHYAYSISFSDGHTTGIYTLDHLRSLGAELARE